MAQSLNKREHRMTLLLASRAFAKAVRRLNIRHYIYAEMTSNFRASGSLSTSNSRRQRTSFTKSYCPVRGWK